MPNKKISQLPVNTNPNSSDVFPVNSNGVTTQLSLDDLTKYLNNIILPKHWQSNQNIQLSPDETLVISGNYVLSGTNLTLNTNNLDISVGNVNFNRYSQIFIGGHLLMIDSVITNNGLISVAGSIIFSGNSNIIGNGILI